MTRVNIALLKSRLSAYLRQVQRGEQIIVTDRETPIAKMVPFTPPSERLQVITARQKPAILKNLKIPPLFKAADSLKALQEERKDDLDV